MSKTSSIVMTAVLLLHSMPALADEPVVGFFEAGRSEAAQRVERLKPCSFPSTLPSDVTYWILMHQAELVQDLLTTRYHWVTDVVPTCASTQIYAGAPITLSFTACREQVHNVQEAAKALLRQSVHHMGVSDDTFASLVSEAVYNTVECPNGDLSPFDPASCTGNPMTTQEAKQYFSPGATESRVFSNVRMYSRTRFCTPISGCADWSVETGETLKLFSRNGAIEQSVSASGTAILVAAAGGKRVVPSFKFANGSADQGAYAICSSTYGSNGTCHLYSSVDGTVLTFGNPFYTTAAPGILVTPTCLRISQTVKSRQEAPSGKWWEQELVILGRY